MADELLRSKHAFGSSENLAAALASGAVDEFDLVMLDGDTEDPKFGWIDRNGNPVIVKNNTEEVKALEAGVEALEAEIATKVSAEEVETKITDAKEEVLADVDAKVEAMDSKVSEVESKVSEVKEEILSDIEEKVESAVANSDKSYEKSKYEIADAPDGTIVDYRDCEIRIMCPADAVFVEQAVGAGGDASCYYVTFKTYVFDDRVTGYIEHLGDKVDAEILTDLKTDEYGRKYQPTWLSIAKRDEAGVWTYYGKNSSEEKYIGWDYQIDWYDANGVMIGSDCIRINLSNEDCHNKIEPYYASGMTASAVQKANLYTDEQIATIVSGFTIVEF